MPEWLTVELCLNVVQSVGVIVALAFTSVEMRRGARSKRYETYSSSIAQYGELARLMLERPELQDLYKYSPDEWRKSYGDLKPNELTCVFYCDAAIGLCEAVWLAGEEQQVADDEWRFWTQWIRDLAGSPHFRWTLTWVCDDYDKEFLADLREIVEQQKRHLASKAPSTQPL